jgi:hypothetical protein
MMNPAKANVPPVNIGGPAQDCGGQLCGWPDNDGMAEIDEIVGDDPEADPAFHSIVAGIPASVETVATLAYADTALTPRAPLLAAAEPAFFLLALAVGALG